MFLKNFQDKDIYAITGQYIGKVKDIILNLKTGEISKISIAKETAIEKKDEEKNIFEKILESIEVPEEPPRIYKSKDLVTVEFNKVIAIGDIIIINV